MGTRAFKDAVFAQLARPARALASPKRLELLDVLTQGPRTVEVLAAHTALSVANASQHLQVLREAQLVERTQEGQHARYRLAPGVEGLYLGLRALAEDRLPELTRALQDAHEAPIEPIDGATLLRRLRSGELVVLDVRDPEEFAAGHLPGARSVPLRALRAHLAELPRDRAIVAYCRGPYCVLAREAARVLRDEGFDARATEQGPPQWRAAGLALQAEA